MPKSHRGTAGPPTRAELTRELRKLSKLQIDTGLAGLFKLTAFEIMDWAVNGPGDDRKSPTEVLDHRLEWSQFDCWLLDQVNAGLRACAEADNWAELEFEYDQVPLRLIFQRQTASRSVIVPHQVGSRTEAFQINFSTPIEAGPRPAEGAE